VGCQFTLERGRLFKQGAYGKKKYPYPCWLFGKGANFIVGKIQYYNIQGCTISKWTKSPKKSVGVYF